jgi:peptidyl-prolyl cis-trans isomerase C
MNVIHRFTAGSVRGRKPTGRVARACVLAALVIAADCLGQAVKAEEKVLVENASVKLTLADYEADLLLRVPADRRLEFTASPARLTGFLNTLLIDKTLAKEARDAGLDRDPDTSRQIAVAADRILATAMLTKIDRDTAADFDAREADFLVQAREDYLMHKEKYQLPERVSASHILINSEKHGDVAAVALAKQTREKLLAGADFATLAAEVSDDPTAKTNGGKLGWFGPNKMDPAFSKAAFALKNVGDLSEPVKSSFGWHIIRLDGRRPAREVPFEQAKKQIMLELKSRYVDDVRKAKLAAISHDPAMKVNQAAVDALVVQLPKFPDRDPNSN